MELGYWHRRWDAEMSLLQQWMLPMYPMGSISCSH